MIALLHGLLPTEPEGLPLRVELPPVPEAKFGQVQSYRLQFERPHHLLGANVARIGGRTIKFKPSWTGERVNAGPVGPDGSVLLCRDSTDIAYRRSYSIYWRGHERPLPLSEDGEVASFFDRRNFAGQIQQRYPGGPPSAPPDAYVFEKGQFHYLGPGQVLAWSPGKPVVVSVPVGVTGRPAGYDSWNKDVLRIYHRGRAYDLGVTKYVGRQQDGSIVFSRGGQRLSLYRWRDGRVEPWVSLPSGWQPLWLTPKGSLVVRLGDEPNWELGWLQRRTLLPIRFNRPARTKGIPLGEAVWAQENGKFRTKSWGSNEKPEVWREYEFVFSPVQN
jgi:hypothetical protein